MSKVNRAKISRRTFLQASAAGAGSLAAWSVVGNRRTAQAGLAASQVISLDAGWLFGGLYVTGSEQPGYDDSGFAPVTTPHTVRPLSWRNWDFSYQNVWIYRQHFDEPASSSGNRTFVDFQGVMTMATPTINGTTLQEHQGGYLPFSYEITNDLVSINNVLAVKVGATWEQVPPDGRASSSVNSAITVDFMEPGGLYRDVQLRVVPQVFIADVWANPIDALSSSTRHVVVESVVDAGAAQSAVSLDAAIYDAANALVTRKSVNVTVSATGQQAVSIVLDGNMTDVTLWSPDDPYLYTVVVTLSVNGVAQHTFSRNVGFRAAVWDTGGFYLNGSRLQLFGLSRHQLFPYVGMAAPARAQRYDANLLKHSLNCNVVRMVHYPHSPHFLDECDRIGLMVWEEIPGWGYLPESNTSWIELMNQNTREMVTRDRNHPCIIVWGVQVNESQLDMTTDGLYGTTRDIARALDGSRATSGATGGYNPPHWVQPVRTCNDYSHSKDNLNASLKPPISGSPYLVTEAVGALTGAGAYRLIDNQFVQQLQARMHAQVVDVAQGNSGYAGITPWSGFDYPSGQDSGSRRIWQQLKWTGVVNTLRILKSSASFYQAQRPRSAGATLFPAFDWDFGAHSVKSLGTQAHIFSNCTSIRAYLDGSLHATLTPDTVNFPHLLAPPFSLDTTGVSASSPPELRLDGYNGSALAVSRTYSPATASDRLQVSADDTSIVADGSDATRVSFMIVDKHGNRRANSAGDVSISISGPGTWGTGKLSLLTMSANPAVLTGPGQSSTVTATLTNGAFELGDAGGAGAVWIQGQPNVTGTITVTVTHPVLGSTSVSISATAPSPAVTSAPALDTSLQAGNMTLSLPSGWTSTAITPTTFGSLAAGSSFAASWEVTAPPDLSPTGTGFLSARASYSIRRQPSGDSQTLPLGIGTSLAGAFNNVGISADTNSCGGDLDGFGNSYSETQLSDAGFGRGARFTRNGIGFTMPNVAAGGNDNVISQGQVILLAGSGQKIGLVGSSTGGNQQVEDGTIWGTGLSGKVSVIYADGTVTTTQVVETDTSTTVMAAQFIMDDWKTAPGHENDTVVQLSSYNSCKSGTIRGSNQLVYAAVPLIVGRPVQAVVLPAGGTARVGIHIFAVGLDNP
jgi:beta-galactosidase